jgi:peptidoglycan/xylan/chitin deacetylase (PgdA/CDA1 family)
LRVSQAEFTADLAANLEALERFGVPRARVRFFVPPYEHYTEEVARWSREVGPTLINYTPGTRSNTDYMEDDDPRFVPADEITRSILDAERSDPHGLNGYLLLMHLGAGPRRTKDHPHERLEALLQTLQARGYRFVRVDELLVERK